MRRRVTGLMLAISLVLASFGGAAAQEQAEDGVFSWPLEEWLEWKPSVDAEREPSQANTTLKPKIVRRGPRSSGAVALTFDDGYNAEACASIADTLRRHGAVGTFFINGQWIKGEPKRWRRILRGMEVANHTRSHRNLTKASTRVVVNQIRSNEAIHEQALGRPMLKVLRPPLGASGKRVARIAKQLGYEHVVLWSVDTGDWKRNAGAKRIVRAATGRAPGSIILLHCARDATAKALPGILRHYQRRGIEVAGLSTVVPGTRAVGDPRRDRR